MSYGVCFVATARNQIARDPAQLSPFITVLGTNGWLLSADEMTTGRRAPVVYDASRYHGATWFGVFEAPAWSSLEQGLAETTRLGWDDLFRTVWLIGPRDLAPTPPTLATENNFGFLALWNWNDAWHAATPEDRRAYDADCDRAFARDTAFGALQAGRFATGLLSAWDQLALWEVADEATLTSCMAGHEAVGDFQFTTSRHLLGRRVVLSAGAMR